MENGEERGGEEKRRREERKKEERLHACVITNITDVTN